MSFKTRPGFTLAEVMIATVIMGIMFVSIFTLQVSITRSVSWITQRFERMSYARDFFIESAQESADSEKEVVTLSKKITTPALQLHYQKKKLKSDEPFGKFAHDIYKQQVTLEWQDERREKKQETLIGYVYQPQKQKKTSESKPKPPANQGGGS